MVSRRRRFVRFIGWCIAVFASVAAVLLLIFATYLIFFDHSERLRQKLEAELSAVAGSPVSIGSINLNWTRYAFELRDISVAGPDEEPLLTVDRVWGQLRLSEILRFRLHWTELLVQRLTLRLPKVSGESVSLPRTTGGDSGVSISAERVALEDASILIADETLPWRFEASNLGISIERTSSGSYAGRLDYEDGGLVIKDHPEMRGSVSAAFEIAAGELLLHEARALSELGELRAKGKLGLGGGVRGRFEVSAEGPVERSMASIFGVSSNPQAITGRWRSTELWTSRPRTNCSRGPFAGRADGCSELPPPIGAARSSGTDSSYSSAAPKASSPRDEAASSCTKPCLSSITRFPRDRHRRRRPGRSRGWHARTAKPCRLVGVRPH